MKEALSQLQMKHHSKLKEQDRTASTIQPARRKRKLKDTCTMSVYSRADENMTNTPKMEVDLSLQTKPKHLYHYLQTSQITWRISQNKRQRPDDEGGLIFQLQQYLFQHSRAQYVQLEKVQCTDRSFLNGVVCTIWALIINIVIKTFFGCRRIWNYATGYHNGELVCRPWCFLHGNYRLSQRRLVHVSMTITCGYCMF